VVYLYLHRIFDFYYFSQFISTDTFASNFEDSVATIFDP